MKLKEDNTIILKSYHNIDFLEVIKMAPYVMRERLSLKTSGQWQSTPSRERIAILIPFLYQHVIMHTCDNLFFTKTDKKNSFSGKIYGMDVYTLSPDENIHFVDKEGEYPTVSYGSEKEGLIYRDGGNYE